MGRFLLKVVERFTLAGAEGLRHQQAMKRANKYTSLAEQV